LPVSSIMNIKFLISPEARLLPVRWLTGLRWSLALEFARSEESR